MRLDKVKVLILMVKRNMCQKDLAQAAGISRGSLSIVVNGKRCRPQTAIKIAEALGVDVTEILE